MKPLILIKLGGSLITEKDTPMTARPAVIEQLAKQIAKAQRDFPDYQFILGNGAGSFGHFQVKEYDVKNGMKTDKQKYGYAVVQDAVAQLNRLVVSALLKENVSAISLQPSASMTANNGTPQETFVSSLFGLLEQGITPVLYGDIILDASLGCTIYSTEKEFEILIQICQEHAIEVAAVIHLGKVAGVLDQDRRVIPVITQNTWEQIQTNIYDTEGYDVTGGMKHKIETSLAYAKNDIKTIIANGEESDVIGRILRNEKVGTIITFLPSVV